MLRSRSNCSCSALQLEQVGCDCTASWDAVIVDVFRDGYASDNKGEISVDGGLDVNAEVRLAFGSFAKPYRIRRVIPLPTPIQVSEEYTRAMSRNDNS